MVDNINDLINFILLLVTILSSFYLIVFYSIKGKKDGLLYSFCFLQILIMIWSLGLLFELVVSQKAVDWIILKIYYFGICYIGFSWLFFCLHYTASNIVSKKKNILILLILPSVFYLSLLLNEFHNLFYTLPIMGRRNFGPVFWIHSICSYVYILGGTIHLFLYLLKKQGKEKKKTILVILAAIFPIVTNIIFIGMQLKIEVTPMAFIISSCLFSIASLKYKLFSIIPMSTIVFIDSIKDGIMIINRHSRIESFNSSILNHFPFVQGLKSNDKVEDFVEEIAKYINSTDESFHVIQAVKKDSNEIVAGQIDLTNPYRKNFIVNVFPVVNKNNQIMGRIVSFKDITEFIHLTNELKVRNEELRDINEKLLEHTLTVEELAVSRERNRITRDIHDSVGHTFTLLISLLGVLSMSIHESIPNTEEKISEASQIAKKGLKALRSSLMGLHEGSIETDGLTNALAKMFEDFEKSGMKIDFSVEGQTKQLEYSIKYVLYRTCQEALTNSLKHGKADYVSIILCFSDERIDMYIFDNGKGCENIKKGFGLKGMEERVKVIGGKISYGSLGDQGFNIHMEIPVPSNG